MVVWPAILKYDGDPELFYLPDQQSWEEDEDLHVLGFQPRDQLIDSQGQVFELHWRKGDLVALMKTPRLIPLIEISEMIQFHQSCQGACCAAKVSFRSVAEAIRAVGEAFLINPVE
ncbi:DUF4144 family protein [Photobacterium galatheae]|uniref:Uncharacterized protein n=1 Tax=Photobacterium galatheae TaxID=1654360 RepID=A0A066RW66_9GAMM|nr:DUF4144 family protein [Photobacterium galatheae]KDM91618.1 hypothetical protein EA58_11385 [Photobacterium galatheae]MCM0149692.1 hypothetical protein [Photobacterium galatheae]